MEMRHMLEPEHLTQFGITPHRGKCNKCKDGIVMCMRDSNTLKLRLDCIYCACCGQRYFLEEGDYVKFFGHNPSEEPF